jgi:hypothetical protein
MERLTFLFDPRSPWCYQTSRWLRRVAAHGEVELDWGLLSLEVLNLHEDEDPVGYPAEYGPALRTGVVLLDRFGSAELGRFYGELGRLMWEGTPPAGSLEPAPPLADSVRVALAGLGLDPSIVDEAMADPDTWAAVLREHRRWVESVGAFGVPTLVFGEGEQRRAIFGPVIRELPDDETCLTLWRHVSGLVRHDALYEVKKNKPLALRAGLPGAPWRAALRVRQMKAGRALNQPGGPLDGASLEWAMAAARTADEEAGLAGPLSPAGESG